MGDDFFAFIERFGDDDYCDHTLSLTHAHWSEDALALIIRLRGSERLDKSWRLTCTGVREHELQLGDCSDPWEMSDDHVLLWPYKGPVASLYFSGRPNDPATAVGRLYEAHCRIVGNWHRFDRWFNRAVQVGELLSSGFGLLAEGPEPLILGYQEVLNSLKVPSSILTGAPIGDIWEDGSPASVVVLFGKTFVVAERVEFLRTV